MSLKAVTKKMGDPAQIWDEYEHKLFFKLHSADKLQLEKLVIHARIMVGKKEYKTKTFKKTDSPKIDELFFFLPRGSDEITVEFFEHHTFGDKFVGQVALGAVQELRDEKPFDQTVELTPRANEKKKKAVGGTLHFSYFHSTLTETRPLGGRHFLAYNYKDLLAEFSSGDLVVYEGTGPAHAFVKLQSLSCYSQVGLVVSLANKWTEEQELYILECTRNIDGFLDSFEETTDRTGWCLFRLKDRVHHMYGGRVWWAKHKALGGAEAEEKARESISHLAWEAHCANDFSSSSNGRVVNQTLLAEIKDKFPKFVGLEFDMPHFVSQTFEKAYPAEVSQLIADGKSVKPPTPAALLALGFWEPPVEIRTIGNRTENAASGRKNLAEDRYSSKSVANLTVRMSIRASNKTKDNHTDNAPTDNDDNAAAAVVAAAAAGAAAGGAAVAAAAPEAETPADEEAVPVPDAAVTATAVAAGGAAAAAAVAAAAAATAAAAEKEQTPEEQEAERKAKLKARMARLGRPTEQAEVSKPILEKVQSQQEQKMTEQMNREMNQEVADVLSDTIEI